MPPQRGEETDNEEEDSSYLCSDDGADSEENDDDILMSRKSLLFLCQEGQIKIARKRLLSLKNAGNMNQIQKEIFQVGRDKNYPLHEILMGGTSDTNALAMTEEILEIGKSWKGPFLTMMNSQPPSHSRTPLHWAAWGNATLPILRSIVTANPEALVLRDGVSQGSRTPLAIFLRYYFSAEARPSPPIFEKNEYLERVTKEWKRHRLRLAIYKAAIWFFREQDLVPFNQKDRKENKIKPGPWFALSVIGDLRQREMQPLVWQILEFIGKGANAQSDSRKKRKRGKG